MCLIKQNTQRSKMMKFVNSAIFLVAVLIFSSFPAFAQETEAVVVDEVVAQVNDGVITLSRIKREIKQAIEAVIADGKKSKEEAKAEIDGKQGELIANLINEELLIQKAKEVGADSDVDAMVNQRFAGIMKEQGIKSLDKLYEVMRGQGLDPEDIKANWRRDFIKGNVIQREVTSKIYQNLSGKEIKEYFNANKEKFIKPETITLSEIFLSFAGRDEKVVRQRAKDLVATAKKTDDFTKLALENSERPDVKDTKGKVGSFAIKELNEKISNPLRGVKQGDTAEPVEIEEGIMILHVDERTTQSSEGVFDEDEVRKQIAYAKAPEATKKYMINLRKDAYIKVNESYRAIVNPILFEEERMAKPEATKKGK
jgi:PPIC-type PPIASE domain/SurA N-terminal domain